MKNIAKSKIKKSNYHKAFTLIELIIVLGLISVLVMVGFAGYYIFRNETIVNNTAEGAKTFLRLAQDKALTISVDNNDANNDTSLKDNPTWVYGYSFEYDQNNHYFIIYKISDPLSNTIPNDNTKTSIIRNYFYQKKYCNDSTLPNSSFPLPGGLPGGPNDGVKCTEVQRYTIDSGVVQDTTCNIFFSAVNGYSTIAGVQGGKSCYIKIAKQTSKRTIQFVKSDVDRTPDNPNPSLGEVKSCSGLQDTCP